MGVSLTTAKHQADLQLRRQSVLECRNSGLTVKQWCAEHHIDPSTYYRWQKEVWDCATQSLIPVEAAEVRFAEISVPANMKEPGGDADIILKKDGWSLEIRSSASSILLDQVLRAVNCHG